MNPAAVLTDLDGTLLEHGGVLGPQARAATDELRRRGIPVVPLTSKTEAELRGLLAELSLGDVGGFENGAAILGPSGVVVSERAIGVDVLDGRLEELAGRSGLTLSPVTRMATRELRRITGLPEERIPAMLSRRFGLPFLAPEGAGPALDAAVRGLPGLRLTRGGIFWHLSGDHGKEDSLDLLLRAGLVRRPFAGFGDAPNDLGFLGRCDVAILVPGPSGAVDAGLASALPAGRVAPFPAGRGWAAAAMALLQEGSR